MHGFPSASLIDSSSGGNAPLRRKSSSRQQSRKFANLARSGRPCRAGPQRHARNVATPVGKLGASRGSWAGDGSRQRGGRSARPRGRGSSGFRPARGNRSGRSAGAGTSREPCKAGIKRSFPPRPPSRRAPTCVAAGTRTSPKASRPAGWAVSCRLRARRSHLSCRPGGRSTPLARVDPLTSQMRAAAPRRARASASAAKQTASAAMGVHRGRGRCLRARN